jgi:hypothetical protein
MLALRNVGRPRRRRCTTHRHARKPAGACRS